MVGREIGRDEREEEGEAEWERVELTVRTLDASVLPPLSIARNSARSMTKGPIVTTV